MKEKKIGHGIILGSFIFLCISWILWIPLEQVVDSENYENREMTEKPSLTGANYKTFATEYESYVDDNLPFRNTLVQLNNEIDYFLFKKSSSDRVIIGEDNWLFYANASDGNPISCYQGTNLLSNEKLHAIAQNCITQRDFLLIQGKEFVVFIAPNKERVYSEYMPDKYGAVAENYAALQIYNYLKENTDLRVVYPYEEIMDAKNDVRENIYYKTDTHWNYLGGYVGSKALLRELGIEIPDINSEHITITSDSNTSGDLAGMLNLKEQLLHTDKEYTVEGYDMHDRKTIEWNFNEAIIYQATDADPRKIYVIRDSFASAMALYIGSQFNDSYLRHRSSYTYENLVEQNPDIVVYEIVERYATTLETFSIKN